MTNEIKELLSEAEELIAQGVADGLIDDEGNIIMTAEDLELAKEQREMEEVRELLSAVFHC